MTLATVCAVLAASHLHLNASRCLFRLNQMEFHITSVSRSEVWVRSQGPVLQRVNKLVLAFTSVTLELGTIVWSEQQLEPESWTLRSSSRDSMWLL